MYELNITKLTDGERLLFVAVCALSKKNHQKTVTITSDQLNKATEGHKDVVQRFLTLRYKDALMFTETSDINVFSEIRTNRDRGEYQFSFTDRFYEILLKTPYEQIEEYMSLTGKYPHLLYKLLTRLRYSGYYEIPVEDLYILLSVPKSYNTSELSRVVISPAVRKLARLASFEGLKYGYYTGRNKKAQKVIFEWMPKDKKVSRENL